MRVAFLVALLVHAAVPSMLFAQSLTPGKYSGRMEYRDKADRPRSDMVTLTIDKADGNQFEGVAWIGTPNCRRDVPVRGKIDGDTLKVRGGEKEECSVRWDLKWAGDALEGSATRGRTIRLSK
jgi:hypothetical protein